MKHFNFDTTVDYTDRMHSEVEELTEKINAADDWTECLDEVNRLIYIADLETEWAEADGDDYMEVLEEAARRLGVEIDM